MQTTTMYSSPARCCAPQPCQGMHTEQVATGAGLTTLSILRFPIASPFTQHCPPARNTKPQAPTTTPTTTSMMTTTSRRRPRTGPKACACVATPRTTVAAMMLLCLLSSTSQAYFAPRSSSFPTAFGIRRNHQQQHEHHPLPLPSPYSSPSSSSSSSTSSLITSSQARIQAWRSFRRLPSSLHSTPTPSPPPPSSDRVKEALRRQRILAMQNEISEEILLVSEEERETAEAAKRKLRQSARKAIYQAYNKVGGEVAINEIGIPKKMTRMSKSKFIDEEARKKDEISRGKSYAARKFQLLFDSLWLSALGLALCWAAFSFEASVSYALGASLGFGYITLLGRTVEAIGTAGIPGAGVGQARFALVILLVLLAGKYRDTIQVIPAIVGFSMYQFATFLQAFDREDAKEKKMMEGVGGTVAPPQ